MYIIFKLAVNIFLSHTAANKVLFLMCNIFSGATENEK
jgi:hypothetical protein